MGEKQYKYIGKPFPRVEAREKTTGQAMYVYDMELPGMLYAKCLHSPHARAKILSIDTSEAEALPGVKAVLGGKDVSCLVGLYMVDKCVLAQEEVRYQGEVVAAVAAVDEVTAEKAVALIKVEYEVLTPVLSVEESLEGKILVHEDINELKHLEGVFFPQKDSNIASWNKTRRGDMDKGFQEADYIIENEFYVPPVGHVPMETHVAIAQADPYSDKIEVWTSSQSPFALRDMMANAFNTRRGDINIHIPYIGGGFGGKSGIHLEPLVTILSKAANGRPVKLKASREQEFNQLPTRAAMRSRVKTGVKKDGKITAFEATYDWDSGAYADYAVNVGKTAVYSGAGPYELENVKIDSRTLYTNKVFSTAYRGFGHLETHWAIERQMDLVAQKIGMDPVELRRRNILKPGSETISGEKVYDTTGSPLDCLEAVVKELGWTGYKTEQERNEQMKNGKIRAKGIALLQKAPAMPSSASSTAIMQMDEDGRIKIMIGAVDMGQGANTALASIAAEVLDIPVEDIEIVWQIESDKHPYDWNTVASKLAFMGGNAILNASESMLNEMKDIAAGVLRCSPKQLTHGDGYIYHVHHRHRRISYQQLARGYVYKDGNAVGGPLISKGVYIADGLTNLDPETGQGYPALDWTFGAHGADIEVDVETGEISVIKMASAFDVGQVLNKTMIDGQIMGGVMQGIGSAILEGYKFSDDGKLLNPSFTDNKIPTAKDAPLEIVPIYIENPQFDGPFGARGVAEHPMISVPSAIGNALYNATGVNFYQLPLSPENVALGLVKNK